MDCLPLELKEHACEYLDNSDLKSLRQVNKVWDRIAAPCLYRELNVTPSSLQGFVNLSGHRILREYLNSLTFFPNRLQFILPEMWDETSSSRFPSMTTRESGLIYQKYALDYRKQLQVDNKEYVCAVLHSTPRFSKLRAVTLSCLTFYPLHSYKKYEPGTVPPPAILDNMESLGDCEPDTAQLAEALNNFLAVTEILSSQTSSFITTFKAGVIHVSFWTSDMFSRAKLQSAFRHLRYLRLVLCGWETYPEDKFGEQMKNFSLCFHGANALEMLMLQILPGPRALRLYELPDMLVGLKLSLPKLRILELGGFITTKSSLQTFLGLYRYSLTTLDLHHITLLCDLAEKPQKLWPSIPDIFPKADWKIGHVKLGVLLYVSNEELYCTEDLVLRSMEQAILYRVSVPQAEPDGAQPT